MMNDMVKELDYVLRKDASYIKDLFKLNFVNFSSVYQYAKFIDRLESSEYTVDDVIKAKDYLTNTLYKDLEMSDLDLSSSMICCNKLILYAKFTYISEEYKSYCYDVVLEYDKNSINLLFVKVNDDTIINTYYNIEEDPNI